MLWATQPGMILDAFCHLAEEGLLDFLDARRRRGVRPDDARRAHAKSGGASHVTRPYASLVLLPCLAAGVMIVPFLAARQAPAQAPPVKSGAAPKGGVRKGGPRLGSSQMCSKCGKPRKGHVCTGKKK